MSSRRCRIWHLVGAGNIGTLAAYYLQQAGMKVRVISRQAQTRTETLSFAHGMTATIRIDCIARTDINRPVQRLLVACKTPFTAAAVQGLPLADDAIVLRLQNGMGSLDGLLGPGPRLIEAVTTNAVMQHADGRRQVVAENQTWIGPGLPLAEFQALAGAWPGLEVADNIQMRQWKKLIANAAINPLTALFDVPNGALLERSDLHVRMQTLVTEADRLFKQLDDQWAGNSLASVEAIAQATAANTSSMRADLQRGQITEIQAINGWLVRRGETSGLSMTAHRRIVEAVEARHPR